MAYKRLPPEKEEKLKFWLTVMGVCALVGVFLIVKLLIEGQWLFLILTILAFAFALSPLWRRRGPQGE